MASNQPDPIVVSDLRGGRNDTDPPMSLPLNQCTEALNVDWKDTTLAHKRGGAATLATTGGTAFANGLYFLHRHLPSTDALAELWAADNNSPGLLKRMAGGTAWANVTLDDAMSVVAGAPVLMDAVSFNGKLWLAYFDSTGLIDRLHVYDPSLSSPRVRRVGLAVPAAPTVADSPGAGAYPAVLAYWRVRWLQVSGSSIVRRSNPSASTAFTPSGANDFVVITRPTAAGEGETHWEIEVSLDDDVFYQVHAFERAASHTVIATTAVGVGVTIQSLVDDGYTPDEAGLHGLFPNVRFLMTDGNRLLGGGAWVSAGANSGGKQSRIWHTPVLGSADKGDGERIENTTSRKGWTDLNENDGGGFTGCGGPLNGQPWWFKSRQVWKLLPTQDATTPYLPRKVRDDVGCPWFRTISMGEDHTGRPALYFLSHRGPYRITYDGDIQYLGRDNEVTWRSMHVTPTVYPNAVFYPDLHQWWVWIPTSGVLPTIKMVLDVHHAFPDARGHVRGGWTKHTGVSATANDACLFANTPGATMSSDMKPYIVTGSSVLKCDTSDTDDAGTDFQSYITTRPLLATDDLIHKVLLEEPTLIAKASAGADVSVTVNRDFGKETRTASVSLAPVASETRVVKKIEALEMGEADAIQITIGDASANDEAWAVDAIVVPVVKKERK